jgi:N-acetylmuramoyl-L-alanine amidase CwlA
MTIFYQFVPQENTNHPRRPMVSLDYITIHCTGNHNPGANARAHARYQYNGSGGRKASWHYTADKDEIWQSFEDTQMCWHTGNARGNAHSTGIEICVNDRDGFPIACANAARLTARLLLKYNLPLDRVVQHHK